MNTPDSMWGWAEAYHLETQTLLDRAATSLNSFHSFDVLEGVQYRRGAEAFFSELDALQSEIESRQENLDRVLDAYRRGL